MTWAWYAEQPREIFIDLDDASPKRTMAFAARLRGAIKGGRLDLDRYFFLPSTGKEGLHIVLTLLDPMLPEIKTAWSLYLLSDRYRAACNLMREARKEMWYSVLIEPEPVPAHLWRECDAVCECANKHDTRVMGTCPVGMNIGRKPAGLLFGTPDGDGWRDTILDGVLGA